VQRKARHQSPDVPLPPLRSDSVQADKAGAQSGDHVANLKDLGVGAEVVIYEAAYHRKPQAKTRTRVKAVHRVNLVTEDGRIWSRESGVAPKDPCIGIFARAEPWDENHHPYEVDAEAARRLLYEIWQSTTPPKRRQSKTLAELLPTLQQLQEKLGGST
jgi:hypothetical protein